MKRGWAILLVAAAFAVGAKAFAHHSFAATYLEGQDVTVEGDLVQFMFRNPHSFVQIMAPDPQTKQTVQWAVEWAGNGQLHQAGISAETLRVGDHVIIKGSPGRNPEEHRVRLRSIERPKDGWHWAGPVE